MAELKWVSEPEYVGEMPIRVELFSEPYHQFQSEESKAAAGAWYFREDGTLGRCPNRRDSFKWAHRFWGAYGAQVLLDNLTCVEP
jgi:hypothetical protein